MPIRHIANLIVIVTFRFEANQPLYELLEGKHMNYSTVNSGLICTIEM